MSAPIRSAIAFETAEGGRRVEAHADAEMSASSAGLPWKGLVVEEGAVDGWEARDLVSAKHFVAVNVAAASLTFERKEGRHFRRVVMPPGSCWVNPAGTPFTHLIRDSSRFVNVLLDPELLDQLVDDEVTLRLALPADAPQIAHLAQALAAEARQGGPNGPGFASSVGAALAGYLARSFVEGPAAPGGALRATQVRRVQALVEERLGDRDLSVEDLARAAGMSSSHFSRQFRAAVGSSPYRYLLRRRIERARDLILSGPHRLSEVALAVGFADQAHLSRAFKQLLGVSPRAFGRGS
jgi:AraC family transcriptional regulator